MRVVDTVKIIAEFDDASFPGFPINRQHFRAVISELLLIGRKYEIRTNPVSIAILNRDHAAVNRTGYRTDKDLLHSGIFLAFCIKLING
jgi:hypothetical protein